MKEIAYRLMSEVLDLSDHSSHLGVCWATGNQLMADNVQEMRNSCIWYSFLS